MIFPQVIFLSTGDFRGDHVGQIAVICRTNFALFNNAVLTCAANNKTRIGFAGVSIASLSDISNPKFKT